MMNDQQHMEHDDFIRLTEDEDHLWTVEGAGIVDLMEHREEVLFSNFRKGFAKIFAFVTCCKRDCFRGWSCRRNIGQSSTQDTIRRRLYESRGRRLWPDGFGPGWFIRSFCPLILVFWAMLFYDGVNFGLQVLHKLSTSIASPPSSRSKLADDDFMHNYLHVIQDNFPANVVMLISSNNRSESVLTPDIEHFCKMMKEALSCNTPLLSICQNDLNFLGSVIGYDGYYYIEDTAQQQAMKPYYVNGNESSTIVILRHKFGVDSSVYDQFYVYLEEFIASNGPNEERFTVEFTDEQKLLKIAQDEVLYDFEHADLIGMPVAWILLISYCGSPGNLVIITLPVTILVSFYFISVTMPSNLSLATFAPSIIVSIAVALSVDYALFMLVRYSEEIKQGAPRNFALDKAISTAGKTISVSGSIMLVSNGCLYFVHSETIAAIGLALAITNLVAIFVNITLLPALLFMFGRIFDRMREYALVNRILLLGESFVKLCVSVFENLVARICGQYKRKATVRIIRSHQHVDPNDHSTDEFIFERESIGSRTPVSAMPEHFLSEESLAVSSSATPPAIEPIIQRSPRRGHRNGRYSNANSRIWGKIANLCVFYPNHIIVCICVLSIPIMAQVRRFRWTDSQANIVPTKNHYVNMFEKIGNAGFPEGWLADFRMSLQSPVIQSNESYIDKENCFDDNLLFHLKKVPEFLHGLTCSNLIMLVQPPGSNYTCGTNPELQKIEKLMIAPGFFTNFCPVSCNSCSVHSVLSKPFIERAIDASRVLLNTTFQRATMNIESSGGTERAKIPILESIAQFLGRTYTWERIKGLLMHPNTTKKDDIDEMYQLRFHTLVAMNGSEALFLIRPPFHPYNDLVHKWWDDIYADMETAGFSENPSPKDISKFRFLVGGTVTRLFDQVDEVFRATPSIMFTSVVVTVLGTSALAFQSLLLGPRLLVTIALTIGLVYGLMVLIFQDAHASPDGAGVYWIVPVLATPIVVGCTLDYDSFVVARIFEMRSSGMSTTAAVFAGLQETGHVITIAGVIMTVAFGTMLFSAIPVLQQIGAILVLACLIDTFVIRSLLVPSLMMVAKDYNWYPKEMPPATMTMEMLRGVRPAQAQ